MKLVQIVWFAGCHTVNKWRNQDLNPCSLSVEVSSLESSNFASASSWGALCLWLCADFSTLFIECGILYSCVDVCVYVCTYTHANMYNTTWCTSSQRPPPQRRLSCSCQVDFVVCPWYYTTIVSVHTFSEELFHYGSIVFYTICFPTRSGAPFRKSTLFILGSPALSIIPFHSRSYINKEIAIRPKRRELLTLTKNVWKDLQRKWHSN